MTADLLRRWLGDLDHVTVRPVLQVGKVEIAGAPGYAPPPRARDRRCVFPGCGVTSRACDLDHVVPYDPSATRATDGATHPDNLAPLCRRHHRLKTRGRWHYVRARDGSYRWTSPRGLSYDVNAAGTRHPSDTPAA